MKKVLLTLVVAMVAMVVLPATVAANNVTVTIDGQPVVFADQAPVIVDGHTLVPVRGVFEALGFNVAWNGELQQVALLGEDVIIITIGSTTFETNGASFALDAPAQTINGRTMLPVRAVVESIGYTVVWDAFTATVIITSPVVEAPAPTTDYRLAAFEIHQAIEAAFAPGPGVQTGFIADTVTEMEMYVLGEEVVLVIPGQVKVNIDGEALQMFMATVMEEPALGIETTIELFMAMEGSELTYLAMFVDGEDTTEELYGDMDAVIDTLRGSIEVPEFALEDVIRASIEEENGATLVTLVVDATAITQVVDAMLVHLAMDGMEIALGTEIFIAYRFIDEVLVSSYMVMEMAMEVPFDATTTIRAEVNVAYTFTYTHIGPVVIDYFAVEADEEEIL